MLTVFSPQPIDYERVDVESYECKSSDHFGRVFANVLALLVQLIVNNDERHRNLEMLEIGNRPASR